MNVIYIIGNGFDLRLGLPTSYPDFLKFYKVKRNQSKDIDKMKLLFFEIMDKKEEHGETDWRDLEVALGQFTNEFPNKELFQDFYLDINISLTEYLKKVEEVFWETPTSEESNKFFQDLMYPYSYFTPRKKREIFSRFTSGNVIADIICFNYTSSLEAFLTENWRISKNYEHKNLGGYFQLRAIKHIHHTLKDNGVLFGVNDLTQVNNTVFQVDDDILDLIVKPQGNEVTGSLVDEECRTLIENATLICIFGTSLGQTDKFWWECIRDRFMEEPKSTILFFDYQKDFSSLINTQVGIQERISRQKVMDALGIEGNENELRDRIFIAINKEMFPSRPNKGLSDDMIKKFLFE